ncbi:MAG: SGF29 tudor-like domain-containing protein [Olpidium bornovanus]|uniref:SGF29 tudor-like domain-containing protein n=1 Tax=Olpidium bornovanus TaxID=278681 RepID=A0A8H7ZTS2_9FUNG|nr:MAG: SGF29 tudor-like domain-containing protein [Olpidium bornovanus]
MDSCARNPFRPKKEQVPDRGRRARRQWDQSANPLIVHSHIQHLLSRKNVLALPSSPPVGAPGYSEYRAGSHILALYPGTTCFYKAIVVEPPSRCRGLFPCSTYIVMFEDDGGREVGIEARLVVQRR